MSAGPQSDPAKKSAKSGGGLNRPLQAPDISSLSAGEVIGLAVSAVWLFACAAFFIVLGGGGGNGADPLRFVIVLLAIFMPVALIWVAVAAMRSARIMREESNRLQAAIDGMRQTYLQQQAGGVKQPSQVERKLEEIAAVSKKTETALATFTSIRPGGVQTDPAMPALPSGLAGGTMDDQTSLALGTPLEDMAPPLSIEDFIRALHFPENENDAEGFRALRRALSDRKVSGLVQASQDVLTLLSQDGIYMDDLRPDRAKPEIWRKFAAGERGRTVATLGGVRDRSSLALTAGRMRQDPIFRDAAHHFLRKFDQTFADFEKNASDSDIAELSNTRTARAFMLLGRVTGTFD
ncbi:hypothetical protein [Aliiroseovarius crassostreae]|uniref:Uncharacterized protein n=1 Tax=Aliiroseovarius crassostreae TaxID=154981 RepID=A0A9Q9H745_9RHOB|nr:hypothetical protein [Aliiroseovarius crassostreae]UWP88501.1 hypothetical protein K3J57_11425 [Aliiroseovarius crassostreae]UWP94809.1 hypothetical protein K3X48_11395 [Aliiroseovarius crassostreae]UWP97971.1 hypothetical protein K3X53_11400 [Aliiroseovarius crassostreae]